MSALTKKKLLNFLASLEAEGLIINKNAKKDFVKIARILELNPYKKELSLISYPDMYSVISNYKTLEKLIKKAEHNKHNNWNRCLLLYDRNGNIIGAEFFFNYPFRALIRAIQYPKLYIVKYTISV